MSMFDNNSHIKNLSKSLLDAVRQVAEGKKPTLDPVGQEDSDIDNDGKANTKSDKYLLNRRAVRSAAIKEGAKADTDYDGDGKVESPHAEHNGARRNAIKAAIAKKMLAKEEAEQIDELSNNKLTSYRRDAENDLLQRRRGEKDDSKSRNREVGIKMSTKKIKEEAEQIDELKKSTVASFAKQATDPTSPRSVSNLAGKAGFEMGQSPIDDYSAGEKDDKKAFSRSKSVMTAVNKLAGTAKVNATNEEHMGFKKLEKKIEGQGKSAEAASAIAASIGRKKFGKEKFQQMAAAGKKHMEEEAMDGVAAGSLANDGHQCATKIFKEGLGEGTPLFSQHAKPAADGSIAWYDCVFEDTIERCVIGEEGVEILESEWHSAHPNSKSSKKMKKHMEEEVEQIDEMKDIPTTKLKAIVARGESDEEGMSPAFGMQVKAARNELARRKKMGLKEEVEEISEAMGAKDRYMSKHADLKALVKSIGEHLDAHKKDAMSTRDYTGNTGPNWGHVGDLGHYHDVLSDIHDSLARNGEYAKKTKIAEDTSASTEARKKIEAVARPGRTMADAYTEVRTRQGEIKNKVIDEAKTGRAPDTGNESKYHIMNQLGKAAQSMAGEHEIWFKSGEKKPVKSTVAQKLLAHYRSLPKPADKEQLQKKLHASHDSLQDIAKGL